MSSTMINKYINTFRVRKVDPIFKKSHLINNLLQSREVFNVQTVEYDFVTVCSMDMDEGGNFLLVGLSNGNVDLQGVQDPTYGKLDSISQFSSTPFNCLHRVQWNPGDEQFFSVLDNNNLFLIDPIEMRIIERFDFQLKTNWSEWNAKDRKTIAVCASESQVRLVDIRTGCSIQTIILNAKSGSLSHRATRCLWSKQDSDCLIVGDNEGFLHIYDTRHTTRPLLWVGEERGQISGMSFTSNQNSIITSQGTDNHLIEWHFDKCTLRPVTNKFRKRKKEELVPERLIIETEVASKKKEDPSGSGSSGEPGRRRSTRVEKMLYRKVPCCIRRVPLPVDAYLRCQFYVTDRHIYCPVPTRVTKSKEIYIFDLETGYRIKTLKSQDILRQGVNAVVGLLPDSLVLYVGGRGRLRVWTVDEDHQRRLEEKMKRYHQTIWDSDEDL